MVRDTGQLAPIVHGQKPVQLLEGGFDTCSPEA